MAIGEQGERRGAAALVSVVVPVYADADGLRVCLDALSRQTYRPFEVVVVDNGAEPSLGPVVAPFAFARLVHEPAPGSYAARNAGVAGARGAVLAFTDADCRPAPDWLARGTARLGAASVVAGRIEVVPRDAARPNAVERVEMRAALRQQTYVEEGGFGATANLLTTAETFGAVGPFDAALRSGGDLEWCRRATAAGRRLVYADDARVAHPARRTLAGLLRKTARIAGGFAALNRGRATPYPGLSGGWRDALPPVRASVAALRDQAVPLPERLKMVGVLNAVQAAQTVERVRLRWGGAPVR